MCLIFGKSNIVKAKKRTVGHRELAIGFKGNMTKKKRFPAIINWVFV